LFNRDLLRTELAALMEYAAELAPPLEGDENHGQRFFWRNSQFSYSDAMSYYYCFIRRLKPRTVVEIGGGFSTLLTLEALRRNGRGKVVCVEPFPRPFLMNNTEIELHQHTAQEISAAWLNNRLQDGDVVSIDSTHTVKTGSDCVHIYLRLLPRIERNVYVHAHDIFIPFGVRRSPGCSTCRSSGRNSICSWLCSRTIPERPCSMAATITLHSIPRTWRD
jgi:hypothetical protein